MKSTLGKVSGLMISLAIIIASIMILKQTSIATASNENQTYNETEPIRDVASQIQDTISNAFSVIVSENIKISDRIDSIMERNETENQTMKNETLENETIDNTIENVTLIPIKHILQLKILKNIIKIQPFNFIFDWEN